MFFPNCLNKYMASVKQEFNSHQTTWIQLKSILGWPVEHSTSVSEALRKFDFDPTCSKLRFQGRDFFLLLSQKSLCVSYSPRCCIPVSVPLWMASARRPRHLLRSWGRGSGPWQYTWAGSHTLAPCLRSQPPTAERQRKLRRHNNAVRCNITLVEWMQNFVWPVRLQLLLLVSVKEASEANDTHRSRIAIYRSSHLRPLVETFGFSFLLKLMSGRG